MELTQLYGSSLKGEVISPNLGPCPLSNQKSVEPPLHMLSGQCLNAGWGGDQDCVVKIENYVVRIKNCAGISWAEHSSAYVTQPVSGPLLVSVVRILTFITDIRS